MTSWLNHTPLPNTTPNIPQHIDARPASESIGIRVLEKQIEMQNDIERLKETTALAAMGYCGFCPHVSRGTTHPQPAPCMAHHGYSCGHNIQALHRYNQMFEDHGPVYSHHMHVPHHPNQMVEDLGHDYNHLSHSLHAPHHPNQVPEDRVFKRYTYHHPTHIDSLLNRLEQSQLDFAIGTADVGIVISHQPPGHDQYGGSGRHMGKISVWHKEDAGIHMQSGMSAGSPC